MQNSEVQDYSHRKSEAFPVLQRHDITSLRDLRPFFMSLCHSSPSLASVASAGRDTADTTRSDQQTLLNLAENALMQDFLEPFSHNDYCSIPPLK